MLTLVVWLTFVSLYCAVGCGIGTATWVVLKDRYDRKWSALTARQQQECQSYPSLTSAWRPRNTSPWAFGVAALWPLGVWVLVAMLAVVHVEKRRVVAEYDRAMLEAIKKEQGW